MASSNTDTTNAHSRALFIVAPLAVVFVAAGLSSGMWIQLSLLAVSLGIFLATISLRKTERTTPQGGQGARIITLESSNLPTYGIDAVEDLDEVA